MSRFVVYPHFCFGYRSEYSLIMGDAYFKKVFLTNDEFRHWIPLAPPETIEQIYNAGMDSFSQSSCDLTQTLQSFKKLNQHSDRSVRDLWKINNQPIENEGNGEIWKSPEILNMHYDRSVRDLWERNDQPLEKKENTEIWKSTEQLNLISLAPSELIEQNYSAGMDSFSQSSSDFTQTWQSYKSVRDLRKKCDQPTIKEENREIWDFFGNLSLRCDSSVRDLWKINKQPIENEENREIWNPSLNLGNKDFLCSTKIQTFPNFSFCQDNQPMSTSQPMALPIQGPVAKDHGKSIANQTGSAMMCQFCRRNGDRREFCESHRLRDEFGNIECPILQAHACEICGATGKKAHTKAYCPVLKAAGIKLKRIAVCLQNTPRNSSGRLRKRK